MADRNQEVLTSLLLQKELREAVRLAVNRLRNYGITLKDVHAAMATELGRTSASLQDRKEFVSWLADFSRRALDAWDIEQEEMGRRAAPARRKRR